MKSNTIIYSQLCPSGTQANFVGLKNKLDLQTCFQNGTHLYEGAYYTFYTVDPQIVGERIK